MFEHDFLAPFPEIFLIIATIILLIYGVVLSTSKKYDYPPLVRNVSWLRCEIQELPPYPIGVWCHSDTCTTLVGTKGWVVTRSYTNITGGFRSV